MTGAEMAELFSYYIGAFGVGYACAHQLLAFKQSVDKSS